MSQYNNKGMASDLSLGRPTPTPTTTSTGAGASDSNIAAAASRHTAHAAYFMQHVNSAGADPQKELSHVGEYDQSTTLIGGLECYVRALQGEREKLDAFRRELPICMGLLDDAIQATREKLTKAVASSRMIACQASYGNNGNHPAYAANVVNSRGGVHSTLSPREQEASMHTWSLAGSKAHDAHAAASHVSDDDPHPFEKQQQDTHFSIMAAPHFASTSPHLHLINYPPPPPQYTPSTNHMFLNKFQQKEGTLFNQEENEMMRRAQGQRKAEGFQSTLGFSSARTKYEDEQRIMIQREGINRYEEGPANTSEHFNHDDLEAATHNSPTLTIANNMPPSCHVMNNNSMNGIMTSQTPRKARRCWSPDLHQRFLHALHQLGGPQSATPKQIREVMHVEGLTNDEVKSHLQKFRLHTRRPAPIQASEPAQQPHHLVLFGGIWVPTSPAESTPAAQLAACQLVGGGHATSSGNHNPYMPFQHVIGQNPMQALMRAASSDQLDVHAAGLETASEVDVARSDQSTSQNGGLVHEDEDTEIHLGSKPIISREITSPIAKARYQ